MHLRLVFSASVPKSFSPEDSNEDVFRFSGTEQSLRRVALSDGASESYDSKTFAGVLCDEWISSRDLHPILHLKWALKAYEKLYNTKELGWAQAAAYERGSFATFAGLAWNNGLLSVIAVGDTQIFVSDARSAKAESFPYTIAERFAARPVLVSTSRALNHFFRPSTLRLTRRSWNLNVGAKVLLMTDALGAWCMKHEPSEEALGIVTSFKETDEFAAWVICERMERRIRDDDTTLIYMQVADCA